MVNLALALEDRTLENEGLNYDDALLGKWASVS